MFARNWQAWLTISICLSASWFEFWFMLKTAKHQQSWTHFVLDSYRRAQGAIHFSTTLHACFTFCSICSFPTQKCNQELDQKHDEWTCPGQTFSAFVLFVCFVCFLFFLFVYYLQSTTGDSKTLILFAWSVFKILSDKWICERQKNRRNRTWDKVKKTSWTR